MASTFCRVALSTRTKCNYQVASAFASVIRSRSINVLAVWTFNSTLWYLAESKVLGIVDRLTLRRRSSIVFLVTALSMPAIDVHLSRLAGATDV